jgi:hypothetical protein
MNHSDEHEHNHKIHINKYIECSINNEIHRVSLGFSRDIQAERSDLADVVTFQSSTVIPIHTIERSTSANIVKQTNVDEYQGQAVQRGRIFAPGKTSGRRNAILPPEYFQRSYTRAYNSSSIVASDLESERVNFEMKGPRNTLLRPDRCPNSARLEG